MNQSLSRTGRLRLPASGIYCFLLLTALLLCAALPAAAQKKGYYYVGGIVRDSISGEALPFASVAVSGRASGAVCNDKGIFEMSVSDDATEMQVTCLGYDKKIVPIRKGAVNMYDVHLSPSTTELKEVVVRRQKYSKKDNPAVTFAQKLRDKGALTDPERNDYYNYDKYQIVTFALNNFVEKGENSWMFRKFPFLWEHVDTSEVSGKPILNILAKEKASTVHYRREPRQRKEMVTGIKSEGIDEIADAGSMQALSDDILREIDLYDNDLVLLQNRFVSPLSRIAPDFYKFYLTDTVDVGGEKCIVLSFYPHNQAVFGFNGQIYVPMNDSTMFIKKVSMRSPRNINLNFIDNIYIAQEFERAPDGSRLKVRDDMTIELKILQKESGFYVRRNVVYAGHNFDRPDDMAVFDYLQDEIVPTEAKTRDEGFWDEARLTGVTENEKGVGALMKKLRSVPVYYWTEKTLKVLFTGYVATGKNSKFDYGPVNTSISTNDLEGIRLRAGGMTTANLSRRFFARGYTAYGTKDHKWKYNAEVEWSFIDKDYHSREFPVHSLRLTGLYDIDQIGQHYLFTNMDNVFLSLKRMPDNQITYHRVNKLEYTLELQNHFSVLATVQNERQEATRYINFTDGYGRDFGHYTENSFTLALRWAKGEKFYQGKTYRIPINMDAPIILLSHTVAPKGFCGSRFPLNKTELSLQKRFWFSAFGYLDVIARGAHVWSRSPFPNLLIANANLSYTIQPESFALMNPMEFVNDSYATWDVTYWANGAIFNYVPYLKNLKLREVFAFRGVWGHLSDRNDPALNPDLFQFPTTSHVTRMTGRPYMEVSVGVENIFKVLRLDYVWRLSYLDVPYDIDRRGLRLAVHVTF